MKLMIIKSSNILHESSWELLYRPYIDYSDIHRIYNSLDAALLGIMAYKYEGCNYHADEYMCKLLGIKW